MEADSLGFVPDVQPQANPAQNSVSMPEQDLGFVPDEVSSDSKYDTAGQKIKTAVEGVAEGVLGPVAPFLEKRYLNVKPEEIRNREEAHPVIKGAGQFAGLLSPVGEGAALSKVGESIKGISGLAKDSSLLAKIGVNTTAQAAEMGLFQAGDEISKMIKENPDASADSAIANVGLASALGGAFGGVLSGVSPLFKAAVGDKVGKLLEDFKGEAKFALDNPDLHEAFTKELGDYYVKTTGAFDSTWGHSGIKSQAVDKLAPELNEKIIGQTNDFLENTQKLVEDMKSRPNRYPAYLVDKIENSLSKYTENAQAAQKSSDLFNATNQFKRELQGLSKFDKQVLSISPEYEFLQKVKGLGNDLRIGLEDKEVWGKAGEVQQKINSAASKYFKPLEDFERTFTGKINGEKVIDPGKTNTFINQMGNPRAEIKTEKLKNFMDASQKFQDELSKIHSAADIENTMEPASTAIIGHLLQEPTAGSKLARKLIDHGLASIGGKTIGGIAGGLGGMMLGHPEIGFLAGEYALGPLFSSVLPGVTKPLLDNPTSVEGIKSALDYGIKVAKGDLTLSKSTKNVFKSGAEVISSKSFPDKQDRERVDKMVDRVTQNPENMMNSQPKHLGHYLPDHQGAVAQHTTNAVNYLKSIKPQAYQSSPLDRPIEPTEAQKARYDRALNIAVNPAVVLQHIKDGTLQTTDLQDLKTMFPNYYQNMCSKLTSEMIGARDRGETIPYKTKIAISLALGQSLDSSMKPEAIIAAQPQPKQPQPQQSQGKTHKGTSNLGKSNKSYMTSGQAAESDRAGRNN